MQSGLENMPIYVQPGMSLVYQPQGINIIMAPSYNVQNSFSSQTIFVDKTNDNNTNQNEQSDEESDQENQNSCELSDEQLQACNQKIYQHPLFPLISILFEICDQLTSNSNFGQSKNVNGEIQSFMVKCHHEGVSLCTGDSEIDELMIETVKVLKIHVLEIEAVQELCKDFCMRYINCLKSTLHSSQLVPPDLDEDSDASAEISSSLSPMKGSGNIVMQTSLMPSVAPIAALGQGQVVSGGTVYQMVQTPHGLVAQPIQIATANSPVSARTLQEPVSIVGFNGSVVNSNNVSILENVYNNQEEDFSPKKSRRGVLPKKATKVMKAWLFQHISHPYPTEDEKRHIASQTNLTLLQVNNWFINGRRRILQPMLNSAAPVINKYKIRRQAKKSSQRFWPDNIAIVKQLESTEDPEEEGDDDDDEDGNSETDSDTEITESHVDTNPNEQLLPESLCAAPNQVSGLSSMMVLFHCNEGSSNKMNAEDTEEVASS